MTEVCGLCYRTIYYRLHRCIRGEINSSVRPLAVTQQHVKQELGARMEQPAIGEVMHRASLN